MSRSTTKQFRAPFASAGGTADGRDEALLFISSTPSDILIWIRDSWATVEGALGGQTWRIRKTLSERFRRRNCTHARENRDNRAEPNGHAWADWHRGPATQGGRGGQQQRERGPQ